MIEEPVPTMPLIVPASSPTVQTNRKLRWGLLAGEIVRREPGLAGTALFQRGFA